MTSAGTLAKTSPSLASLFAILDSISRSYGVPPGEGGLSEDPNQWGSRAPTQGALRTPLRAGVPPDHPRAFRDVGQWVPFVQALGACDPRHPQDGRSGPGTREIALRGEGRSSLQSVSRQARPPSLTPSCG